MTPQKRIRQIAIELFGPDVGCGDGGCVYGHLGGMQTNGGCNCMKSRDVIELTRLVQRLRMIAERAIGDSDDTARRQ